VTIIFFLSWVQLGWVRAAGDSVRWTCGVRDETFEMGAPSPWNLANVGWRWDGKELKMGLFGISECGLGKGCSEAEGMRGLTRL
jgi:hypothetical protein